MLEICTTYRITEAEYRELDRRFGKLCWKAAHELKNNNSRNNFTDDAEDIKQNLLIDMMRAGSYTKRQRYTEGCFAAVRRHARDRFVCRVLDELETLWENRRRHGANRQKYGPHQERLLERLVRAVVPKAERPDKNQALKFDPTFAAYCKSIIWNGQKSMGKKITREKSIRAGLVSLSEFDYIQGV